MNLRHFALYLLLAITGMLVFCGDSTKPVEEEGDDPVDYSIRGTWLDTLLSNPSWLEKSVYFTITIEDTSTGADTSIFSFIAIQDPYKNIYQHSGKWEISGTSLLLKGDSCLTMDKSSGVLVTAPDSTKNKTITVDTTGTGTFIWNEMFIEKYADVWRAISHNEQFTDYLLGSHLQFKKDTSYASF